MKKARCWYPTLLFVTQRILLSGVGLALFVLNYVPTSEDPISRPYFGIIPVTDGIAGALLGVWQRFDVIHFLRIAQTGYTQPDLSPFLPLFPLLTRLMGKLMGENYLLGSFVVANLFALMAFITAYYWLLDEGYDESQARRILLFLIWFPTSFFLLVPYSESLFLFVVIVALWSARRERWLLAGIASILATLTRIGGVVLSAAFLFEWFIGRKAKPLKQCLKPLLAAMMPLLAYSAVALWRSNQNLPGMMAVQATYWHRIPAMPWEGVIQTIGRVLQQQALPIELLDLTIVTAMLLIGLAMFRRLPASLAVYYWGSLLLSLSQIRLGQPLSGQARYAVVLFPAFIVLAQKAHGPIARRVVAYSFLVLNLYLAGQFILWGWVG